MTHIVKQQSVCVINAREFKSHSLPSGLLLVIAINFFFFFILLNRNQSGGIGLTPFNIPIFGDIMKELYRKKYQIGKGYDGVLKDWKSQNNRQIQRLINGKGYGEFVKKLKSQNNRQIERAYNNNSYQFMKGLTKGVIKNPLLAAASGALAYGIAKSPGLVFSAIKS